MKAVYLKELTTYFKGPLGYVCLGIYYLFGGQFLLSQLMSGTNNVSSLFSNFFASSFTRFPSVFITPLLFILDMFLFIIFR